MSTNRVPQDTEGSRVNAKTRRQFRARKRQIEQRLGKTRLDGSYPMISASNFHYEIADKTPATSSGGIGSVHRMVNVNYIACLLFLFSFPFHRSRCRHLTSSRKKPPFVSNRNRPTFSLLDHHGVLAEVQEPSRNLRKALARSNPKARALAAVTG